MVEILQPSVFNPNSYNDVTYIELRDPEVFK